MLDIHEEYDVAVIDEMQMILDEQRGHAWTRALFGVQAETIVLTGQPEVVPVVKKLAQEMDASLSIFPLQRRAGLVVARPIPLEAIAEVPNRTAFVTFKKRDLIALRNALVEKGRSVAAIYGSLGPIVRREEARRFRAGDADILVATDAIGMGLNLPIDRLYFYDVMKFDGVARRQLTPAEIRQIGGRAGRYFGPSQYGEVGVVGHNIDVIRNAFQQRRTCPIISDLAWAGPTVEHLILLSDLMQSNRLSDVLTFFCEHVHYSSQFLRMTSLTEIHRKSSAVDALAPHLGIDTKWQLACAPFSFHKAAVRDTWTKIIEHLEKSEQVFLDSVCTAPEKADLSSLEEWVEQLTLYDWTALRFEESLPDRSRAEKELAKGNELIIQLLSSQSRIDLPPPNFGDKDSWNLGYSSDLTWV